MKKEPGDISPDVELQKQRSIHRLGGGHPVCCLCGEDDPLVLELHHVGGRAFDPLTAVVCGNCHKKQPSSQRNSKSPTGPPIMERIGNLLIGLADLFMALVEALRRYGEELIKGAPQCPFPWGQAVSIEGQS